MSLSIMSLSPNARSRSTTNSSSSGSTRSKTNSSSSDSEYNIDQSLSSNQNRKFECNSDDSDRAPSESAGYSNKSIRSIDSWTNNDDSFIANDNSSIEKQSQKSITESIISSSADINIDVRVEEDTIEEIELLNQKTKEIEKSINYGKHIPKLIDFHQRFNRIKNQNYDKNNEILSMQEMSLEYLNQSKTK